MRTNHSTVNGSGILCTVRSRAHAVAIDLPLKILAWQDTEGKTWVAYNEAEYLRTRHGFPFDLLKNIAALDALAEAAAGRADD